MPTFRFACHINAAPLRVWHVLSNPEQFDLQSADTSEQVTSTQKHGVGSQMRVARRMGPFTIVLNGRVVEWEEARAMTSEWSSGLPFAITTRVQMTLVPEGQGTLLNRTYAVEVRLPLVGDLLAALLTRNTPGEMQLLVKRIKQAAEQE